jgi:hypothetical protein
MLSKQAIEEFQEIYLKTYGEELSFAEASEQAHQMLGFVKFAVGYPVDSQQVDTEDSKATCCETKHFLRRAAY